MFVWILIWAVVFGTLAGLRPSSSEPSRLRRAGIRTANAACMVERLGLDRCHPSAIVKSHGRGLFTVTDMALKWHETAPGLLYEAPGGDSGRRYVVAFDGERLDARPGPALRIRSGTANRTSDREHRG
jgi:hypothetical protein